MSVQRGAERCSMNKKLCALFADLFTANFLGELRTMVHKEALRAGEFVFLLR